MSLKKIPFEATPPSLDFQNQLAAASELERQYYDEARTILLADARSNTTHRFNDVLKGYNLPSSYLAYSWRKGYGPPLNPDDTTNIEAMTKDEYRLTSLARIMTLEQTHPGGSQMLHRLNRIRNFGRCSLSLLSYLCDNRTTPASRVLSLTWALEDWNGYALSIHEIFDTLSQDPFDDMAITLTEMGEVSELSFARDRILDHGKDAKAHGIFLEGHGDKMGIALRYTGFGHLMREYSFTTANIHDTLMPFLGEIAIPDTTIAIPACNTGKGARCFAKTINQVSGLRTIASQDETHIQTVLLHDRKGILRPEIMLAKLVPKGNTWEDEPSPTRTFRRQPHAPLIGITKQPLRQHYP